MKKFIFSANFLVVVILAVFFLGALLIRIDIPFNKIFTENGVKFSSIDAYYHLRLVDNYLHHAPQLITYDPFTHYPYGNYIDWTPFFDWSLGSIIWILSLGSPDQHTVDVIAAYLPAILGALCIIPMFFIGKVLFNKWVGLMAGGLLAIMPGEFLGRSVIGATDHHVAEVLLSLVAILFLVLATKNGRGKAWNFHQIKQTLKANIKPIIYVLCAGIFLGIYIITWIGGLLFVLILFGYFVVQFIIDYWNHKPSWYLAVSGTIMLLVAMIISMPQLAHTSLKSLYWVAFIAAILVILGLAVLAYYFTTKKLKPLYYLLAVLGFGLITILLLRIIDPGLFRDALEKFSIFTPQSVRATIQETRSFFAPGGQFTLSLAWNQFTLGLFLSLISLIILIYRALKKGQAELTLVVIWFLVIFTAIIGQRRFEYYFAANIALFTGFIAWEFIHLVSYRLSKTRQAQITRKKKKKLKTRETGTKNAVPGYRPVLVGLSVVVVFFAAFFPNIGKASDTAKQAANLVPSDSWVKSLTWLKANTPEYGRNYEFYYELYQPPPKTEYYVYPHPIYSIMAWWDYGHWINRISHRAVITNPFQQNVETAANFFIAQNEYDAKVITDLYTADYIITDDNTATSAFNAIPGWVGKNWQDYFELYYQQQGNTLKPVLMFYPEYYRSMIIRLHIFDGKHVDTVKPLVISYSEEMAEDATRYKRITSIKEYTTYEEAEAFVKSQQSGNYRIVSNNAMVSPVPLEKLNNYELVYSSGTSIQKANFGIVPEIKIFKSIR